MIHKSFHNIVNFESFLTEQNINHKGSQFIEKTNTLQKTNLKKGLYEYEPVFKTNDNGQNLIKLGDLKVDKVDKTNEYKQDKQKEDKGIYFKRSEKENCENTMQVYNLIFEDRNNLPLGNINVQFTCKNSKNQEVKLQDKEKNPIYMRYLLPNNNIELKLYIYIKKKDDFFVLKNKEGNYIKAYITIDEKIVFLERVGREFKKIELRDDGILNYS